MASLAEFVRSLQLAKPTGVTMARPQQPALIKDKSEQGLVDGGSLVSFTSKISDVHKSDVLNSTLLAQLAADHAHNRFKETEQWYNFYVDVLGKVGWVIQNVKFEEYNTSGQTFKASTAILDIIKGLVSGDELAMVQRTLSSLQSSDNEKWWVVFDKKSSGPSQNGNFQVAPCNEDSSGQVLMSLGSYYFQASVAHDRWLWFDYSSANIHFFKSTQVSTLNEDTYSQVRKQIIDKLGDNAKQLIGDINI